MKIRIIIAEPQKMVAEGIRSLLEKEGIFEVLAVVHSEQMVIEKTAELKPEVVVLSVDIPELSSSKVTQRILTNHPDIKIIFLFNNSNKELVPEMLKAGASGYVLKECPSLELINTIKNCVENHCSICPLVKKMIKNNPGFHQNNYGGNILDVLTDREQEIIRKLVCGASLKEIADSFNISVKTADVHKLNLMKKLNINSLPELTKFAIREGITSL